MIQAHPLAPLLEALKATSDWLRAAKIDCAVVGGVAASIYGRPRATRDIDLVAIADETLWSELLQSGAQFGIGPRQADALEFAKISRVILLEHRPTAVEIDLSVAGIAFETSMVASATPVTLSGVEIRLARPDDILVMKSLALRPRDIADIEGILQVQEGLDLNRVREVLSEFSEILEQEDYVAEWDRIVKRVRGTRPGR